jgi:hypothetical protein
MRRKWDALKMLELMRAWIVYDRVHGCVFDMPLKKMCKTHLSAAKQEIPDLD